MRRAVILTLLASAASVTAFAGARQRPADAQGIGQAIFSGHIEGPIEADQPIVAFVLRDGKATTCGAGTTLTEDDETGYSVEVAADGGDLAGTRAGCGVPGAEVRFYLTAAHRFASASITWGPGPQLFDLDFSGAMTLAPQAIAAHFSFDAEGPFVPPLTPGLSCGVERWAVKTLSDAAAGQVKFGLVPTTVSALIALTPPPIVKANAPRFETEKQTYRIEVQLVGMKREDDRDIHLVVADPTDLTKTMIAELPDPACAGVVSSAKKAGMAAARDAFIAACGSATRSFRRLSGTAIITGVAFFDVIHGQTGVAPNGIELHPILTFSSPSCERVSG